LLSSSEARRAVESVGSPALITLGLKYSTDKLEVLKFQT